MTEAAMVDGKSDEAKAKGKKSLIPLYFFAFFGVVLLANGALVSFALSTWSGLEEESPYQKGINYNQVVETERARKALGWTIEILDPAWKETATGTRQGRFVIRLLGRRGEALEGAEVRAHFLRPTRGGVDRAVSFQGDGRGGYAGLVELPLPGQWDVRISLHHRDLSGTGLKAFQETRRIHVN